MLCEEVQHISSEIVEVGFGRLCEVHFPICQQIVKTLTRLYGPSEVPLPAA